MSDYLDLDDLQEEYQVLKDDLFDGNLTDEESKRYHEIIDFVDECGFDPDDNYWGDRGPGIPEHMFLEYAQMLAEDTNPAFWEKDGNGVLVTEQWPLNCIDWKQAANDLKYDYSLVTFDGEDYYIRSW